MKFYGMVVSVLFYRILDDIIDELFYEHRPLEGRLCGVYGGSWVSWYCRNSILSAVCNLINKIIEKNKNMQLESIQIQVQKEFTDIVLDIIADIREPFNEESMDISFEKCCNLQNEITEIGEKVRLRDL